jgi:uncharacterized membrane protein
MIGYNQSSDGSGSAFVATLNNDNWTLTNLGTFEDKSTKASDINDAGLIVGHVIRRKHPLRSDAILFSEGEIYDLKALVTTGQEGWSRLTKAVGINNSGQIIGTGIYNDKYTSFILTPINQDTDD